VIGGGHDLGLVRKTLLVLAGALTVTSGIQYLLLAPRYVEWDSR
jgi:hypothetical protein